MDCAGNFFAPPYYSEGCSGGASIGVWEFYKDKGTLSESQYPYQSGGDGLTRQCTADFDATQTGLITDYNWLDAEGSL